MSSVLVFTDEIFEGKNCISVYDDYSDMSEHLHDTVSG